MSRSWIVLRLLAFVLVVVAVTTAGPASATSPGRNGRALYGLNRSTTESGDIFAIDATGGARRNLTQTWGLEDNVAVSPDGRWIAFVRCEREYSCGNEIFVMHPDGSGLRRIADNADKPVWSPDSREIAYAGTHGELRVAAVDGTGDRQLGPPSSGWHVAWSPDGTRIAYVTGGSVAVVPAIGGRAIDAIGEHSDYAWNPDGSRLFFAHQTDVFSVAPDGADRRLELRLPGQSWALAFAPDGRLAVVVAEGGVARHAVHVFDGRVLRRIAAVASSNVAPSLAWSPDGRLAFARSLGKLIFVVERDLSLRSVTPERAPAVASVDGLSWLGSNTLIYAAHVYPGTDLYTREVDGSAVRRLTNTFEDEGEPAWSPDGRRIAFASSGDIRIIPARGGRARRVTRTRATESAPTWSPDGTELAFSQDPGGRAPSQIVVRDLITGRARVIRRRAASPEWSPDGTAIAAVVPESNENPSRVLVMRPDGSGVRLLSDDYSVGYGGPSWSPDGRRLVFNDQMDGGCDTRQPGPWLQSRSAPPPCMGIVIVSRTGKRLSSYYDRDYDYGPAEWSPDGRMLVIGNGLVLRNGARVRDSRAALNLQPRCTLEGTNGGDRLRGTTGNDVICGFGGNDRIDGRGGHDVLYGGEGADVLVGGAGPDWLFAGPGVDRLLARDRARDVVDGGHGRDRITADARDVRSGD